LAAHPQPNNPDALRQQLRASASFGRYLTLLRLVGDEALGDEELAAWQTNLVETYRYAPRAGRFIVVRGHDYGMSFGRLLIAGYLDDVVAEQRRRLARDAKADHTVDKVMAWGAAVFHPDARVQRFKPPNPGDIWRKLYPIRNAIMSPARLKETVGPVEGPAAYARWRASGLAAETAQAVLDRLQQEHPNAQIEWPPKSRSQQSDAQVNLAPGAVGQPSPVDVRQQHLAAVGSDDKRSAKTQLEDRPGWYDGMEEADSLRTDAATTGQPLPWRQALLQTDLAAELPASKRQLDEWVVRFKKERVRRQRTGRG
jgi:hypothetical protein